MTKRLKITQFRELIKHEGLIGKIYSRADWKNFASLHEVMVPSAFWKEFKISHGKYGLPEDTSIQSPDQVNEDIGVTLPDDEFDVEIEDDVIGIIKNIKVTDLISGQSMASTIKADASETSIKNVVNFYKKRLRHL